MPANGLTLNQDFSLVGSKLVPEDADHLKDAGIALIESHQDDTVIVNLAGVTQANSILVAVLLEWYRHTVTRRKQFSLAGASSGLQAIIAFSGLDELLASS